AMVCANWSSAGAPGDTSPCTDTWLRWMPCSSWRFADNARRAMQAVTEAGAGRPGGRAAAAAAGPAAGAGRGAAGARQPFAVVAPGPGLGGGVIDEAHAWTSRTLAIGAW